MPLLFHNTLPQMWQLEWRQIDSGLWSSGLLIASIVVVGAINIYPAIVVSMVSAIAVSGYWYHVTRHQLKCRFFTFWSIWWSLYMVLVIECILPLLEILPEEHFILILLSCLAAYCALKVNRQSHHGPATVQEPSSSTEPEKSGALDEHKDIESGAHVSLLESSICHLCQKRVAKDAVHCRVCGFCIRDRYHHSYTLNCCISPLNHCRYILCLVFGLLALLLAANLMLTTICHPFLLARVATIAILLPDDCSNVFETYTYGLALMAAIYAVIWCVCILISLLAEMRRTISRISRQRRSIMGFGGFFAWVGGNRKLETTNGRNVLRNCMNVWRKITT